jgi:acetyl esterase/lipase
MLEFIFRLYRTKMIDAELWSRWKATAKSMMTIPKFKKVWDGKLLEAGVRVTAVRYHGTIHDFVMLNAITDDPAPRAVIEQASHMLKKILST